VEAIANRLCMYHQYRKHSMLLHAVTNFNVLGLGCLQIFNVVCVYVMMMYTFISTGSFDTCLEQD
jgi:hypothetical protein